MAQARGLKVHGGHHHNRGAYLQLDSQDPWHSRVMAKVAEQQREAKELLQRYYTHSSEG